MRLKRADKPGRKLRLIRPSARLHGERFPISQKVRAALATNAPVILFTGIGGDNYRQELLAPPPTWGQALIRQALDRASQTAKAWKGIGERKLMKN